jgi:hypothetical protein
MHKWTLGLLIAVFGLAACAPNEDAPLPTLVSVQATTTPAPIVQGTARATLPPTFTLTPTETPTPTASVSPTITVTPSATITDTPTATATLEPTVPPQERPLTGLLELAAQVTLLPTNYVVPNFQGTDVFLPSATAELGSVQIIVVSTAVISTPAPFTGKCAFAPSGGFANAYASVTDLAPFLGCPLGNPPTIQALPAAWQTYQGGSMLWLNGEIFAFYSASGTYQYFIDTFTEGVDPQAGTESAPSGLFAPIRGFYKVWANNATARATLGWANAPEVGVTASVLAFEGGWMVSWAGKGDVLVLVGARNSGTWRSVIGGA